MTTAPYYDVGDPEQAHRCGLIGTHLRYTLAEPLIRAADRQLRYDYDARTRIVSRIVEELVAQCDPRLLAEMLIVEHWDTAMAHARSDARHVDDTFAAIAARLVDEHEGRHRAHEHTDGCKQCRRGGGA